MVKSDKEMGELEAHFKVKITLPKMRCFKANPSISTQFFGELDKFEQAEDSSIVVKYKTRREAEAAMLKGQKLLGTDDVLNLSWHVETSGGGESVGGSNESVSVSNNGGDNLEVVADLPMEEDEAWRR